MSPARPSGVGLQGRGCPTVLPPSGWHGFLFDSASSREEWGREAAELHDLPPTLDGHQTAEIFGCSYWSLLEQVKTGTSPVEPIRLGRNLRWATVAVLRVVGVDADAAFTGKPS